MKIRLAVLTLTMLALVTIQVDAGYVIYTDRAAFNAAAGGGLNFESFENTDEAQGGSSVTYGDLTFVESNGINFFTHTFINSYFTSATTDGAHSIWYDDNGSSISTLTINSSTAIRALGLDIATATDSTVTIGGDISASIDLVANTPGFFGVISDTAFNTVSFSASGGPEVGFDAVAYGQAVPEPAAIAAWSFLGLIGIALVRRRRKKVA